MLWGSRAWALSPIAGEAPLGAVGMTTSLFSLPLRLWTQQLRIMSGWRRRQTLRMAMRSNFWLFLLCSSTGCATPQSVPILKFGCEDVAVVGRIKTVGESAVKDADPLPNWRSAYQLRIQIKRVIRGSEHRRIVPATVIAHAQIRDDRDFLILLKPDGAGGYSLVTASLWEYRPKLGGSCS